MCFENRRTTSHQVANKLEISFLYLQIILTQNLNMHQIVIKLIPCTCTLCFIRAWISGQKQNDPHSTPSLLTRFGNKWFPSFPKTQDTVTRTKFNDITIMQSKSLDPFAQFKYCTSQNTSTVAQFQSLLYKAPRRLMKSTTLIRR
jgi:hypothetical protein